LDRLVKNSMDHQIPYTHRLGGWYLTGISQHPDSWANSLGRFDQGKLKRIKIYPDQKNLKRYYPYPRSEAIAHAIICHQIGFTNQCIRLGLLNAEGEENKFEETLENLISYTLFQDEAPLPNPLPRDISFTREFEASFADSPSHYNLNKLNLQTRLLEYSCSYMLKSKIFRTLPTVVREIFFTRLRQKILEPPVQLENERVQ